MIGLMDCNSFYASCEQVFRPDLSGVPVVVLSNNDGCIVAMNAAAKALDIRRGTPFFQARSLLASSHAAVFSSNYALYQSMSNRVMDVVRETFPMVEIYSIDEAFIPLPYAVSDLLSLARCTKSRVEQCTGIPVSLGFGRTKTLAKIANRWAKKRFPREGCFVLQEDREEAVLRSVPVADIWGVGTRKARVLIAHGITTAWDLRNASEYWVKKRLSLVTLKTLWELRGKPSIADELVPPPRKGILSSQSFSRAVTESRELEEAVASYAERAAAKLHAQGSTAAWVSVFITTSRFAGEQRYGAGASRRLDPPADYLPDITNAALGALGEIWRPGFRYAKAGVFLFGIDTSESRQPSLFTVPDPRKAAITRAAGLIREKYGHRGLRCLHAGGHRTWSMRQEHLSPRYTTSWADIPQAR